MTYLSPKLTRAFRRGVLQHLAENGARTLDELEQDRLSVLRLPLERDEIAQALDSSRRLRHIEPIGESGWKIHQGEWGLTDLGLAHASRLTSRAFKWFFTSALTVVVALLTVGAALGIDVTVEGVTIAEWIARGMTAALFALVIYLVLQDYRFGVPRKTIAVNWRRYERARPHGFDFYRQRTWMLLVSVAAIPILAVLIAFPERPILWVLIVLGMFGVTIWFGRLYRLAREEWRAAGA
jgi:hypothetical protein